MDRREYEPIPGSGYGHLLENPVLFLLFSHQSREQIAALTSHFGGQDRCIIAQIFDSDRGQAPKTPGVIGIGVIKQGGTYAHDSGPRYFQELEEAVRRTKRHKYRHGNDLAVCVILDNQSDACRSSLLSSCLLLQPSLH